MKEPEKECPECLGPLNWKVVYDGLGNAFYNGLCTKCNIVIKGRETPDLRKGRLMAEEFVDIPAMDKRLTRHSCQVQLGVLRALQHCATCENNIGDPCKCKKCKCVYCKYRKEHD